MTEILTNEKSFDPNRPPLRVLSLDGGGMRGHYSCSVLDQLCRRFSSPNRDGECFDLGSRFDLIVGASTGSIIGAGLASGKAPSDVASFYRKFGSGIFTTRVPNFDAMSAIPQTLQFLTFMGRFARKPFNSDGPLRASLTSVFGDESFGSIWARRGIALLIPAVDMSTHNAVVFKTSHIPKKHRDENMPIVSACLASSAAPYFFPLAYYGRPYVDGGLFANNPVMLGIIEALEMTADQQDRAIEIVSVGTCPPPVGDHANESSRSWGFQQWQVVRRVTETVLDAQVSSHSYMARFLLSHLDRKITMFRLYQSVPNNSEAPKLGLDHADDESLHILERRAAIDAERIKSDAESSLDGRYRPLQEIFSDVPTLPKES